MPKKPNSHGDLQNYVPPGNGDASGEYADGEGSNVHYFTKFEKPASEIKQEEPSAPKQEKTKLEVKKTKTSVEEYAKSQKKLAKKLNPDTIKSTLKDFYSDVLDKSKVDGMSDEDATKLAVAMNVLDKKDAMIAEHASEAKKAGEEFYASIEKETEGIWVSQPKDPEAFEKSLDAKIGYFQFKGKQDEVDKLEAIKDGLPDNPEFQEWKEASKPIDKAFEKYQKIFDEYENPDNAYSQKKKDAAVWAQSQSESKEAFQKAASKVMSEWKKKDPSALQTVKDYTGSFSSINYPLRNMGYPHKEAYPEQSKQKQAEFIKRVSDMTKVIDSSTYDFDCWVQRGVGEININGKTLGYGGDVDSLVGTTFKDQGFLSCGSSKGSGFANKSIVLNIYCPKGTKMLYVPSISHFKNEDETIIQRGYSYKITKAYKEGGKIYLDCDVILGSDATKYGEDELNELKEKYF